MADARKLGFAPFAAPSKGVLIVFCEEGLKLGPATRKALAPTGRPGAARRRGRPLHRQERPALEHRRPRRAAGVPPGGDRRRQGGQAQGAGFRQARRRGLGQGSVGCDRRHDLRGIRRRRAQARAVRRHGARHAAPRLCLRPLQDQAQGRRRAARQDAGGDRGRQRRLGAEGLGRARGAGRRRRHGARPDQRAGQRAVSRGVRAQSRRAQEGSASRSRCSTCRR